MNTTLILVGVVCIIAAVVGGGLNALGIELPVIESVRRQIVLGIIGIMLVIFGVLTSGGDGGTTINAIQPLNDIEPANTDGGSTGSAISSGEASDQQSTASSPTGAEAAPEASSPNFDPAEKKRSAIQSVIDELNEATPFFVSAQNQFASGTITYNRFLLSGGDIQVSSTFTYEQGDGTGWPPPSPPTQAVNTYFCKGNATTAKLLKDGVHVIVTTNIIRGPNTSSSTYRIDCNAVDP
jgi:hypothetical protein